MAVKDINRVPDFIKRLEELESMYVAVGILSKTDGEILMIANVHEFGTDIKVTDKMRVFFLYEFGIPLKPTTKVIRIPERSFIRSAYDNKSDEVYVDGAKLLDGVVEGTLSAKEFYTALGQVTVDVIKNYLISEVNSPPNTALTIANKGSSNPLVDTGRLVESIAYEIRTR